MKTKIYIAVLFAIALTKLNGAVIVGSGQTSAGGKKITFILEYTKTRSDTVGTVHHEGKRIFIPVAGVGKLYLNHDRQEGMDFFIMKFGGDHDSLTGFYCYPGGYVGFLRIDLWEPKKQFILYDDVIAEKDVVVGAVKD